MVEKLESRLKAELGKQTSHFLLLLAQRPGGSLDVPVSPKGAVVSQVITVKMDLPKCPKESGKYCFRAQFCKENEFKNESNVNESAANKELRLASIATDDAAPASAAQSCTSHSLLE